MGTSQDQGFQRLPRTVPGLLLALLASFMYLTPKELERLTIFTAAEIARRRKDRGLKLNVPEAIAYIADYIVEGAREDKSVAQLMSEGAALLTEEDVLPGVVDLIPLIQVEAHFADGTKLVSIHNPIRAVERQSS